MGHYKLPSKVKLIIGLLAKNEAVLEQAQSLLRPIYGPEEEVSSLIPFTWTNYYLEEVGEAPIRRFISYENLIARETIVEIKRATNELELSLGENGLRPVNLDPGYMTLGQFFLATTKDQRQRVYLREGIFVEPTLYFEDGSFKPFEWTYRDYKSEEYWSYLLKARAKFAYQQRHGGLPYSTRKKNPA